jgi:hypothetical protein
VEVSFGEAKLQLICRAFSVCAIELDANEDIISLTDITSRLDGYMAEKTLFEIITPYAIRETASATTPTKNKR